MSPQMYIHLDNTYVTDYELVSFKKKYEGQGVYSMALKKTEPAEFEE